MKKFCFFAFFLILFALPGCSVSKAGSPTLDFDQFAKKYRHEDLSAMLDEPSAFLSDFSAACSYKQRDPSVYRFDADWQLDDSYSFVEDGICSNYIRNDVLFDLPVVYHAAVYDVKDGRPHVGFSVVFDSGNWEVDYSVAKAITSYLLGRYDYEEIKVNSTVSTEADLRKLFLDRSGLPVDFSVAFNDSYYCSFFCYERLGSQHNYATSFTIYP